MLKVEVSGFTENSGSSSGSQRILKDTFQESINLRNVIENLFATGFFFFFFFRRGSMDSVRSLRVSVVYGDR